MADLGRRGAQGFPGAAAGSRRVIDGANAAYGIAAAIHSALHASPDAEDIEWFRVGRRGEELDHAETPI